MSKLASLLLNGAGKIDPVSVDDYIESGGFRGIRKAIAMTRQEMIKEVLDSQLLGRGGASYPTGKKWDQLYKIKGSPKYIICNGDEGEPGTYKDRELMQHVPLRIIEGMLIAGYLFESENGIIYIRGEYRKIAQLFRIALDNAQKAGYLGKNIMGIEGFNYTITVVTGAGAYICGENSALLNSIEAKTGNPRIKPPHLAEEGLYGKPTLVNNVESFACIPVIYEIGGDAFHKFGAPEDGGTKLISLSGQLKNRKVFEICLGISLKDIIYNEEIGGGISTDKPLKFCHLGGQSGVIAFPEQLDTKYCYGEMKKEGLSIGSGAIAAFDESVCLVDYIKQVVKFFVHESCGKCTPCRIGTTRLLELLIKFTEGKARQDDLEKLKDLAECITSLSLCGLGQASTKALISCLKHREDEFIAHINGICPAGTCSVE